MSATVHLEISPFRSLNGGSVALSLLLALFAAGAIAALALEAASIGAGPRLAADLPWIAVHVHPRGFTLLGADDALPAPRFRRVPCLDGPCQGPASYDYDALTARLARVKARWPRQDTLFLLPAANVPFEVVFRAVSASTADRRAGRPGQPARPLFPDVRVVEATPP